MTRIKLAFLLSIGMASGAQAAIVLKASSNNDVNYETGTGPNTVKGAYPTLTALPNGNYLVPLERAVGQIRMGASDRRGLHLPNNSTGRPVADGGTGVTQALTNSGAYASSSVDFSNGTPVVFSIKRISDIVTFTVGSNILTSDARSSLLDINALQFRIRSQAPDGSIGANNILISDILFSDAVTANQSLADLSAADGAVAIRLFDGIVGDFTLSGKYTVNWTGTRPGGSALASQIKLLSVPATVPEPSSWALMIAGFGMTGTMLRRRQRASGGQRTLAELGSL